MKLQAEVTFQPFDVSDLLRSRLLPRIEGAVTAAARVVADEARSIVPVDTGALRESIAQGEPVDDGAAVTVEVSANTHYAAYVEFGTGVRGAASPGAGPGPYSMSWPGMVAQPYLRPALDTARGEVVKEFEDRL